MTAAPNNSFNPTALSFHQRSLVSFMLSLESGVGLIPSSVGAPTAYVIRCAK